MLTSPSHRVGYFTSVNLFKRFFRILPTLLITVLACYAVAEDFMGKHGVVIGAYSTPEQVEQSWKILRMAYPELINPVGATIVEIVRPDGELIYRLVLDGLDAPGARSLCDQLSRNGHRCRAIKLPTHMRP